MTDNSIVLERFFEKFVFGYRRLMMSIIGIIIVFLTYQATNVKPEASFTKMIPGEHEFISNFLHYRKELANLGNVVRIVVENKDGGDIFNAEYQDILKQVTDEIFYIPGVNRNGLKSIWTPNVRWSEVTEEGFVGGSVVPDGYDGSAEMVEKLKSNVFKSGQVGRLVGNNYQSATIVAPLQDINPETGPQDRIECA